ncbi:hypothetical protein GH714_016693 [Hevea brasiliensis]|uniref:NmrA-like domain-containing protein n=1 Tax=Hevea brasiliensis TaxID=3981 RepID=A0A6A6LKK6_HEVBR|nr:hypothetical protein GH714_016693 [Hevea brasiliensis]
MAEKNKILIIGGTGYIGKFIVEASARLGHPTFALVRESTLSGPAKATIIDNFKSLGVNFLIGDLHDYESLVKAIKQVDVVISTVGQGQVPDQVKIIDAIKEAGNIKVKVRRAIEAAGIPYAYVASNFFAGYFFPISTSLELQLLQEIKWSSWVMEIPKRRTSIECNIRTCSLGVVKGDQTNFEMRNHLE